MIRYIHAFAMCQSMFCAIPIPWQVWDEEARDKMLLFLPVIGLEMGVLWSVLAYLAAALAVPDLIRGLVLAMYPFLVTGFIHLDGFMDVCDAVGSCRSLERRREILKDSHVGAFAVIGILILMLSQFAFACSAPKEADARILLWIPAVSRCCSALAVTVLKPMSTSQYVGRERKKGHVAVLSVLLAGFVSAGFLMCGKYGLVLPGCLAGYALALRKGYRSLEGMNGDISGYALTLSECAALAVWALI